MCPLHRGHAAVFSAILVIALLASRDPKEQSELSVASADTTLSREQVDFLSEALAAEPLVLAHESEHEPSTSISVEHEEQTAATATGVDERPQAHLAVLQAQAGSPVSQGTCVEERKAEEMREKLGNQAPSELLEATMHSEVVESTVEPVEDARNQDQHTFKLIKVYACNLGFCSDPDSGCRPACQHVPAWRATEFVFGYVTWRAHEKCGTSGRMTCYPDWWLVPYCRDDNEKKWDCTECASGAKPDEQCLKDQEELRRFGAKDADVATLLRNYSESIGENHTRTLIMNIGWLREEECAQQKLRMPLQSNFEHLIFRRFCEMNSVSFQDTVLNVLLELYPEEFKPKTLSAVVGQVSDLLDGEQIHIGGNAAAVRNLFRFGSSDALLKEFLGMDSKWNDKRGGIDVVSLHEASVFDASLEILLRRKLHEMKGLPCDHGYQWICSCGFHWDVTVEVNPQYRNGRYGWGNHFIVRTHIPFCKVVYGTSSQGSLLFKYPELSGDTYVVSVHTPGGQKLDKYTYANHEYGEFTADVAISRGDGKKDVGTKKSHEPFHISVTERMKFEHRIPIGS